MIKKALQLLLGVSFSLFLLTLIFSSPIVMDHARDIYLAEVVAKKAHPVKVQGRTIGSSWQVKYKGKRVTITNNHVCSVVKRFNKDKKVEGKYLTIGSLKRKILLNSPSHDICILEPMGNKYFSLASDIHIGEKVTIIGHPRGMDQSLSDGRIIGVGYGEMPWLPKAGVISFLKSTALSYPGNSGSPVVNRYGNVVGILFAGYPTDYVNINMIVPLDAIQSVLESYVGR